MRNFIIIVALLISPFVLSAQILAPIKWSYAAKKKSDTEAVLFLKATIDAPWHIYSAYQEDGGPLKTTFTFNPSKEYTLLGKLTEPKPFVNHEDVFSMDVKYFEKSVVFQQKIKLKSGQTVVKGKVEFMACTNKECLPPAEVEFSIPVK